MKKLISILITMTLIIAIGILNVYAENNYDCDIVFTPSTETVEPGKTIEITVSAKNINAGGGITGISAVISYDTEVFEEIDPEDSTKNFVKTANWDTPKFFGTTVSTNVSSLMGKTTDQDMFKIKLTVKSDAKDGKYDVTLSSIVFATDDYTPINKGSQTTKIEVKKANSGGQTDGGQTDGGQTDGGQTDGGQTDGGQTDGGKTDGGQTDGGQTDGGQTDGGQTDGGQTDGGQTDGGQTDGGQKDSDKTDNGKTTEKIAGQDNIQPSKTTQKDTTVSDKKIAAAGVTVGIGGLLVLAGIAIVAYMNYKKYKGIK